MWHSNPVVALRLPPVKGSTAFGVNRRDNRLRIRENQSDVAVR